MDKMESLNHMFDKKSKFNFRQFFMIGLLFFATAGDILMDYVNAGFNPEIFYDPAYWVKLALTCTSVVLVTLAVRDFFREKELSTNSAVLKTQEAIDNARAEMARRNLTTKFDNYVEDINKIRKIKAYKDFLQFRLAKSRSEKTRQKYHKLLASADKNIEFIPTFGNIIRLSPVQGIQFNKIRIATIFSRVEPKRGDDDDMESNEKRHLSDLLFKKLFILIGFSVMLSTLFLDPGDFGFAVLINSFSKLFRVATSMYLGASDGQDFVKGTLVSKMKLRLDFIQKFLESEKEKSKIEG